MAERWNAYKLSLKEIGSGNYNEEGYLSLDDKKVRRVNVIGDIVNKFVSDEEDYGFLVLDDGTETLRIKSFEETISSIKDVGEGDLCKVIGRVRKYQQEVYIVPEIVKKLEDMNEMILRKLELIKERGVESIERESKEEDEREERNQEREGDEDKREATKEEGKDESSMKDLKSFDKKGEDEEEENDKDLEKEIKKIIGDLDENEKGVKIETIIERSSFEKDEVEEKISDLMKNGEIFEPRPGKVRML